MIRILSSVGLLFALLSVVGLWRGRIEISDPRFDLKVALSLLLGMFFCIHLYYYDTLVFVAVGYFFHAHLLRARATAMRWSFIAAVFALAPLFLENALLRIGSGVVRWPVVLIGAWMIIMLILLWKSRAHRAASFDT